jgi:predicted glycosyltransferase
VKLIVYCQHVMGVGHLFRMVEICRALSGHEIVLVSGGPPVEVDLPRHARLVLLPEIHMGDDFQGLYTTGDAGGLERTQTRRRELLMQLFRTVRPDVFLTELYPFGRKAFRFEIDPVLEALRDGSLPACRVVSSVRDVLVEKEDQQRHELRAVKVLNRHFDAVLVHSDPRFFRLEQTFHQLEDLRVPIVYTGFIAQAPAENCRRDVRRQLGIGDDEMLILASAGSGRIGDFLLEAVVLAFGKIQTSAARHLQVFTGPLMEADRVERLRRLAGPAVRLDRFTPRFPAYLAAADLSLSMGGYNTTMNLLAARTPALVLPFAQNQEQLLRARTLEEAGALRRLRMEDLEVGRLAEIMQATLHRKADALVACDLNGAAFTARWLEEHSRGQRA